jgi:hypothetical protein
MGCTPRQSRRVLWEQTRRWIAGNHGFIEVLEQHVCDIYKLAAQLVHRCRFDEPAKSQYVKKSHTTFHWSAASSGLTLTQNCGQTGRYPQFLRGLAHLCSLLPPLRERLPQSSRFSKAGHSRRWQREVFLSPGLMLPGRRDGRMRPSLRGKPGDRTGRQLN